MKKLSGNTRYRRTWWGKRVLQVEEWVLVSVDGNFTTWYGVWRDATEVDCFTNNLTFSKEEKDAM